MTPTLYIKNMVCPRCIAAVRTIMQDLNIDVLSIELGQITLKSELDASILPELESRLKSLDFELLEPGRSSLISRIKALIVEQVHYSKEPLKQNFSSFLSERLYHEYSYLSRLFSSVEGITIEKYIARQKIEKVKELLFYDELTLSEIAYIMDYSNVSYLSTQFKKETGMTPTDFKNAHQPHRRSLDSL